MAKQPTNGPISPEGEAVEKFTNECSTALTNLWARWQDEKEYEDIQEYSKPLKPKAEEHGLTITSMTKKPFGCKVSVNGKNYHVTVNSRSIGWKRI